MDASVVVAVVAAAGGIVSAVYSARAAGKSTERKTDADERVASRQLEVDAYKRAEGYYLATLTRMEAEIARQARQINVMQREVAALTRQVTQAGLIPVLTPEEQS